VATSKVSNRSSLAQGISLGLSAYLIWGLVPIYWPHLQPATPLEILAHRVVWSLLFVVVVISATGKIKTTLAVLANKRSLCLLAIASVLIATNWGLFIWASVNGHILDSALGYYVTPLVSVGLGVFFLKEKLRPLQWVAIAIAGIAVIYLATAHGKVPYVAVGLAASFGVYGYVKKLANVPAIESLAVETLVLFPLALGYLLWLGQHGNGTFGSHSLGHSFWLVSSGVVTAVPLILFSASAIRVPLSTIGLLQYVGPSVQFIVGLWYFHEHMPTSRLVGFLLTWLALVILTYDGLRNRPAPSSKVR
jgi:chloramphenicol-sensitive protein RarD